MLNPDDDDSSSEREERLAETPLPARSVCHGCLRLVTPGVEPDDACIRTLTCLHWMCRRLNPTGQREAL